MVIFFQLVWLNAESLGAKVIKTEGIDEFNNALVQRK